MAASYIINNDSSKIMRKSKTPLLTFIILDGWGIGPKNKEINAIEAARTPFFDELIKRYPYTQLDATGQAVGLERNQMSGPETGHLNIGAGRVVEQDVRVILEDISAGRFFQNPVLLSAINHVKRQGSKLHLMGLMGNADSPHSHPDIFLALLVLLRKTGLQDRTFIHLFTDGRDSFPQSAMEHWQIWKAMMKKEKVGRLASVSGRFYAMDRTKNWDRVEKTFKALTGKGAATAESFEEVIKTNYREGNFDEYIESTMITEAGRPVAAVEDNDGVIFFNLRSDRARQLSKLFVGTKTKREKNFPLITPPANLAFVAMTNFGPDLNLKTVCPVRPLECTMPFVFSDRRQLYIAETEKYAHITYFINGGYAEPIGGEERVMVRSPKVRSYAEVPQMALGGVTETIIGNIKYGIYDYIVANFANADMVGHTGDFAAAVKAIEFIDKSLKKIYQA